MTNISFYDKYKGELEEEGTAWKPVNAYQLELMRELEKITETIELMKDTMEEDGNLFISPETLDTYLQDSFIVMAKLAGCLNSGMYMIYMENASVIRYYMRQFETYVNGMDFFQDRQLRQTVDKNHIEVLRNEIRSFKSTFREWVTHFEKDDFEDEWNLY